MTVQLKVDGMTCGHCVDAVRRALASVTGVKRVADVDLASGEARVEGSPQIEALIEAVQEEGYAARPK